MINDKNSKNTSQKANNYLSAWIFVDIPIDSNAQQ